MVFRFLAGGVGSTGATMVAGTIADVFGTDEWVHFIPSHNTTVKLLITRRGFPMALFAFVAVSSMGLGPASSG
jgi:hypothetical protein